MFSVKLFKQSFQHLRYYSRFQKIPDRIVLNKEGTTFVAWHPEKDFPYECTKAITPEVVEESNTILKTVMSPELKEIFKKKSPEVARQELMAITHTTKHRWFPRARDKKAKKTKREREYL